MSKPPSPSPSELRKALYADLDKMVGKGVGRLMEDMDYVPVTRVSTGTIVGDYVCGGGVPYGRLTELYGPPSGGKTALAMRILAEIQRQGHGVAYIDAEHGAWDPDWAATLGLDPANVYVLYPSSAEQAVRGMLTYLKHGFRGIVLDSIPSMRTEAELKGDVGEAKVGEGPRLWAKALPRITAMASEKETAVIMLNQVRAAIGSTMQTETTAGGWALKHAFNIRIEVRRAEPIKERVPGEDEELEVGYRARLRVMKNRGPMGRRGFTPFYYGVGFNPEAELVDLGEEHDIITKNGSWYSYNGEKMGQGKVQARRWLVEHPVAADTVRAAIVASLNREQVDDVDPSA